jgi:uncharacterized membrane-anchored protein
MTTDKVLSRRLLFLPLLLLLCMGASAAQSQEPAIQWIEGPTIADLGGIAKVEIPKGFLFADKKGTQKLLELTQNIPTGSEVGAIVPDVEDDKDRWFVIFEFHEVGFVKDDEKSKLDSTALLKSLQEGTEESNEARKERGWPAFHVRGWAHEPYYDDKTNNLTWAIRGSGDSGGESVNHSIRILGRRGTMNVDLVLGPEEYETIVPEFNILMTSFEFHQGSRYGDFVSGDKVAAYGLTALVAGGVGAAAVKTGLLMKLWKFIVVIVLALKKAIIVVIVAGVGAAKKLWAWLRGRKEEPAESTPSSD